MTTHYIKSLGVAKCREILRGAPNLRSVAVRIYCADTKSYWSGDGQECGYCINLSDLRAELALHDTDHCSDITNHISPTTVVIER